MSEKSERIILRAFLKKITSLIDNWAETLKVLPYKSLNATRNLHGSIKIETNLSVSDTQSIK